jgi:hypothetical protein
MKPIINPWIMYVIGLANNINYIFTAGIVFLFIAIIIAATFGFIRLVVDYDNFDEFLEDYHTAVKWFKKGCISLIIAGIVMIFIPSEKTLYSMVVLENVTPNNIEIAGNTGKDVIDYLFDKIDQMNDEKEDE